MNAFEARLAARPQFGLWQALANPYTAEICAGAGFDFLVFDAEHAPNTIPTLLAQMQAVAPYPVEPVVRLADDSHTGLKQILDIGVGTILVPMIESVEQARRVVAATRYPPQGTRGVGAGLARVSRWNRIAGYLGGANEGICLFLQVESRVGMTAIEAIAALEGVAGIFVGPADLAADMGHLGNPGHPDVMASVEDGIRRIVAAGRIAGVLALGEAVARRFMAAGATLLAVATDVSILARGAEAAAARFTAEHPSRP